MIDMRGHGEGHDGKPAHVASMHRSIYRWPPRGALDLLWRGYSGVGQGYSGFRKGHSGGIRKGYSGGIRRYSSLRKGIQGFGHVKKYGFSQSDGKGKWVRVP